MDFEDYQIAYLLSFQVFITLAGWKTTDMFKKIQKMSSKDEKKNKVPTPKGLKKYHKRQSNQKNKNYSSSKLVISQEGIG